MANPKIDSKAAYLSLSSLSRPSTGNLVARVVICDVCDYFVGWAPRDTSAPNCPDHPGNTLRRSVYEFNGTLYRAI